MYVEREREREREIGSNLTQRTPSVASDVFVELGPEILLEKNPLIHIIDKILL